MEAKLLEIKEEFAKEYGYSSWKELILNETSEGFNIGLSAALMRAYEAGKKEGYEDGFHDGRGHSADY